MRLIDIQGLSDVDAKQRLARWEPCVKSPTGLDARGVDSNGRLYHGVFIERSIPCAERVARVFLGLLMVIATLGFALLVQPVQDLLIEKKEVAFLRMFLDRLKAEEIASEDVSKWGPDEFRALDPNAVDQLDLTDIKSEFFQNIHFLSNRQFSTLFQKLSGKQLERVLWKMRPEHLREVTDGQIQQLEQTLLQKDLSHTPASAVAEPLQDNDVPSNTSADVEKAETVEAGTTRLLKWFHFLAWDKRDLLQALQERLDSQFLPYIFPWLSEGYQESIVMHGEDLLKIFSHEAVKDEPQLVGAFRWLPMKHLSEMSAAEGGFTEEHWLWLTEKQRTWFEFSKVSAASADTFFSLLQKKQLAVGLFPSQQVGKIPLQMVTSERLALLTEEQQNPFKEAQKIIQDADV